MDSCKASMNTALKNVQLGDTQYTRARITAVILGRFCRIILTLVIFLGPMEIGWLERIRCRPGILNVRFCGFNCTRN